MAGMTPGPALNDRERDHARGLYLKLRERFDRPASRDDGNQLVWAMHRLGLKPPPLDELADEGDAIEVDALEADEPAADEQTILSGADQ